jgi:hypothetical protein
VVNTTLNLCRDGLQEDEEFKHFEVALVENEIAYCGSVGDVGPSTSIPDQSASVSGSSSSVVLGPSTRVLGPSMS